jgi:hypothetical protein
MFEDANLFIGLDDASPKTRLETVEKLRASVRSSGSELPVHNLTQLFQLMSDRLKDEDNRVALMSAELLCDLLNRDLLTTDIYFPIVLPAMFQNLANERRRDSSVYVLTTYVEAMGGADCILEGMVQHGLMHDKAKVREQTLMTLPTIVKGYLVPSASAGREDYMKLLDELCLRLDDNDPQVVDAAGSAMRFAQSEDKNFLKHVATLGQPMLDRVTAVVSSSMDTKKNSPRTTSADTALHVDETKQSHASDFDTKDTLLMLKEQEKSASAAVAQLDHLVEQSQSQPQPHVSRVGSNTAMRGEEHEHGGDAKNEYFQKERAEEDDEITLFTRDQKNEIDRIRAGNEARVASTNGNNSAVGRGVGETTVADRRNPDTTYNAAETNINSTGSRSLIDENQNRQAKEEDTKTTDAPMASTTTTTTTTSLDDTTTFTTSTAATTAHADPGHTHALSLSASSSPVASPVRESQRIDIASNTTDRVNSIQKGRDAYSERHGEERNVPIAGGVVNLVYGLIYEPTMDNLRNQSSWKLRASAIEEVLANVTEMSDTDVRLVRPHIPELFKVRVLYGWLVCLCRC